MDGGPALDFLRDAETPRGFDGTLSGVRPLTAVRGDALQRTAPCVALRGTAGYWSYEWASNIVGEGRFAAGSDVCESRNCEFSTFFRRQEDTCVEQ